jgi:DNA-binding MarR family transcriptional regulator
MSRRSRAELEARAFDAIRGWQIDQDLFDEVAADYAGLNRTDARVIDIVQRAGRITAGRLATEARLTSGAVTAVIDRLEGVGLVRRVRDTTDRRRVLVEVTPKVEVLMEPVFGPVAEEGYRTMAGYTDEQVELLLGFLEMSREFLTRHTARVHDLIAERDASR